MKNSKMQLKSSFRCIDIANFATYVHVPTYFAYVSCACLSEHSLIVYMIVTKLSYLAFDDFDFEIVYSLFLDGDVPRSTSYRVYIYQII